MMKIFAPRELRPPKPKSKAWNSSAIAIAKTEYLPKKMAINPTKVKWTCVGPRGMWIKDAMKKRALKIEICVLLCKGICFSV